MLKSFIKKAFYKLFKGVAFPAWNSQLKGLKLIVDPLMPNFHFWRDIEIEGHFVYDQFIKEGSIVFDIGGNIGLHSSYFATRFKNTKVFTFEPLPENAAYLKKLIKLNKLSNIQLIEKAVGTTTGTVYFDRDKNNHQGHISDHPSDLSVQVTTLDDFIKENYVVPNFIKIDVEGFEGDVLEGFKNSIKNCYPIMLIEIHSTEQSLRIGDFFRNLGYTIFRLIDMKDWRQYKQLALIDNTPENGNPPNGLWGNIVVIPDAVKHNYQYLVYNG